MGAFDIAAPLLSWANALLSWLPAWIRVAFWGAASGAVTLLLHGWVSCRPCMERNQSEWRHLRHAYAARKKGFRRLASFTATAMWLSTRRIGLAMYPVLVACVPVLFVVAWLRVEYGHSYPLPGTPVSVQVSGVNSKVGTHELVWPENRRVEVRLENEILQLEFRRPVPTLHKYSSWNLLFGNPNGYIAKPAMISRIEFDLPRQELLKFGPEWVRGWVFVYCVSFFLGAGVFRLATRLR